MSGGQEVRSGGGGGRSGGLPRAVHGAAAERHLLDGAQRLLQQRLRTRARCVPVPVPVPVPVLGLVCWCWFQCADAPVCWCQHTPCFATRAHGH